MSVHVDASDYRVPAVKFLLGCWVCYFRRFGDCATEPISGSQCQQVPVHRLRYTRVDSWPDRLFLFWVLATVDKPPSAIAKMNETMTLVGSKNAHYRSGLKIGNPSKNRPYR
jgi:hypothetical protein